MGRKQSTNKAEGFLSPDIKCQTPVALLWCLLLEALKASGKLITNIKSTVHSIDQKRASDKFCFDCQVFHCNVADDGSSFKSKNQLLSLVLQCPLR